MKFGKLAAVAVFTAASAGFSAPVFCARQVRRRLRCMAARSRAARPPSPDEEVVPGRPPRLHLGSGLLELSPQPLSVGRGPLGARPSGLLLQRAAWVAAGRPLDADAGRLGAGLIATAIRDGLAADRDRDGIPNRYDRDRDNDGVRDHRDRDRDNDGVRNQSRQPAGQPASLLTQAAGAGSEPGARRRDESQLLGRRTTAEGGVAVREAAEALDHRAMLVRIVEHRLQLGRLRHQLLNRRTASSCMARPSACSNGR